MRNFSRFDVFLDSLAGDVYPEVPSEPHLSITRKVILELHNSGLIPTGARVLDIGCGQGLALEQFRALGLEAIGVAMGADVEVCRSRGFDAHEMDQNFLTFPENSFDVLWCRHVLEHSAMPLFTLCEYRRVTKPGGIVYVEVPAPDTSAHHERNPNHYSVLPLSSWLNLFCHAGFVVERSVELNFTVRCGPDKYWSNVLRVPRT
jgi:SAM-dependent methyltransferase